MKKIISFRKKEAEITVEKHTEKSPEGVTYFTIEVVGVNNDYKANHSTQELTEDLLMGFEKSFQDYIIENEEPTEEEQLLLSLGYQH